MKGTELPPTKTPLPEAPLKLSGPFADNMVLPRDQPVPISGEACPGSRVRVFFCGQVKDAIADSQGRWRACLEAMPACAEPSQLMVAGDPGQPCLVIANILIGDVWLASGQSNMWWRLRDSRGADRETEPHPQVRLCTVPQRAKLHPEPPDFAWTVCSPEEARDFSAVAYHFGVTLQREIGVPVGLIHASWGGTRIEAWMRRPALMENPAGRKDILESENGANDPAAREACLEYGRDPVAWERKRVPADPGNEAFQKGWADLDFDDRGWPVMEAPGRWLDSGPEFKQNGVFWFRRALDLPGDWAGKELELRLGACDKHDTTYFNNVPVGSLGWEAPDAWRTPRIYRIPGSLVRAGRNVITSRIYSYMTDGGLMGPAEEMKLLRSDAPEVPPLPLTGEWRFEIEHGFGLVVPPGLPCGENNPNTPCILFENMIRPLLDFGIRGVIWYQGESNTAQARNYRKLFPLLIQDWRLVFDRPELPFLFVQLANHLSPQTEPVEESRWAALREAQAMALKLPATAMAVAIDLGEEKNIHPANKREVGRRLALAALGCAYGRKIVSSGPVFSDSRVEQDAVRIVFSHAGGGLRSSDGEPLRSFAVAGSDGKFFAAEARIEDDTLVVRSAAVPHPVSVRYAWADNPPANLCNAAGLPASPFRTDRDGTEIMEGMA